MWGLLSSNIPVAILMLVGVGLIVFEMYIPGFGVPGVSGLGAVILGFVLLKPTLKQGLLLLGVLSAVLCLALAVCLFTASKGRIAKSRLALKGVAIDPEAKQKNALRDCVGMTGVAHTPLRPAGIAELAGKKLNVVSDGEYIPEGATIRVIGVEGNRIIVTPVQG